MKTTENLLAVENLAVEVGEREVLSSISLEIPRGSLAVLMGANGSGKSTLGLALAGHSRYRVTAGQAKLAGRDLLAMNVEERARAGLFLSFQAPPDIAGVKNNLFIRTAVNAVREARGECVGAGVIHAQPSTASAVRAKPVRAISRASDRSPCSAMHPWSSLNTASGSSDSISCR
jgi:FeS assembly ATPase SufC